MFSECTTIGQNGETIMISVHTEESHAAIVTGNFDVPSPSHLNHFVMRTSISKSSPLSPPNHPKTPNLSNCLLLGTPYTFQLHTLSCTLSEQDPKNLTQSIKCAQLQSYSKKIVDPLWKRLNGLSTPINRTLLHCTSKK